MSYQERDTSVGADGDRLVRLGRSAPEGLLTHDRYLALSREPDVVEVSICGATDVDNIDGLQQRLVARGHSGTEIGGKRLRPARSGAENEGDLVTRLGPALGMSGGHIARTNQAHLQGHLIAPDIIPRNI